MHRAGITATSAAGASFYGPTGVSVMGMPAVSSTVPKSFKHRRHNSSLGQLPLLNVGLLLHNTDSMHSETSSGHKLSPVPIQIITFIASEPLSRPRGRYSY